MNVIKITDERIDAILPKNIKDSEVLNETDKKVLGAILHYFLILDKAKVNRYVILTNEDLRKTICIRKASVLSSVQNLIELGLIKRESGKSWTQGEKPQASKYYVNWDNLKKPIKKPEFEDLFSSFISSETPMGTIDTDIDTDIDKDTDTVTDTDIDTCNKGTCMEYVNNEEDIVDNIVQSDDVNNINSDELFKKEHQRHRDNMCNVKSMEDFDKFNALLQEDISYVDNCQWSEEDKNQWYDEYDSWCDSCWDKISNVFKNEHINAQS